MPVVQSLRPNVTEAEAIASFRSGLGSLLRGPLRSVAAAYVPFHLYDVRVVTGARHQRSLFALDAVAGSLDLFAFASVPGDEELLRVETRNCLDARLPPEHELSLLHDKLRRAVFQAGFFRVRGLRIEAERVSLDLHLPYWIGFHGAGARTRLRVLDAVRRRFEGAKARALFEAWLAA